MSRLVCVRDVFGRPGVGTQFITYSDHMKDYSLEDIQQGILGTLQSSSGSKQCSKVDELMSGRLHGQSKVNEMVLQL